MNSVLELEKTPMPEDGLDEEKCKVLRTILLLYPLELFSFVCWVCHSEVDSSESASAGGLSHSRQLRSPAVALWSFLKLTEIQSHPWFLGS